MCFFCFFLAKFILWFDFNTYICFNSPVLISEKDNLFEIEKVQIFMYLMFIVLSLKISHISGYTISKMVKFMGPLRNNNICSKRLLFFLMRTWLNLNESDKSKFRRKSLKDLLFVLN